MYDTARANTLTHTHLNALGEAQRNNPADVTKSLTACRKELNAAVSGGADVFSATQSRPISDTEASETQATADCCSGLHNDSDSTIWRSHVDELDRADKLLVEALSTPTNVQSKAFSALQKSVGRRYTRNAQYANGPSVCNAVGTAGTQLARNVRAAVKSLKTSA